MNKLTLGERLATVGKYVRQGGTFADIGTDHALLPISLLLDGKIERAICSDINKGPLASARKNAIHYGVEKRIDFRLADGALGLSKADFDDMAICGMGGELICGIISNSMSLFDEKKRLILQPMTKQSVLRKFLFENGFSVLFEDYSFEPCKYYLTLVAEYTGEKRKISEIEAELGCLPTRVTLNPSEIGYVNAKIRALEKSIEGKKKGKEDFSLDEKILLQFKKILDIRGN